MRLASLMLIAAGTMLPATAQAQSRWEAGFGPHLIRREDSSSLHVGGGVTVARRSGRWSGVVEGGGTRREGHNDWRALVGARVTLKEAGRSTVFVHGLAGTLIRQKSPDWAVMPGVGLDVRLSGKNALRIQLDVPIERSQARVVTGVRVSTWLVWSSPAR